MKVSFDFDGCLSEKFVQQIASAMVSAHHDVWVITARCEKSYLQDIIDICAEIGINPYQIITTEGAFKVEKYFKNNFDLHFDDNWTEVFLINERGGKAVLVNPDYEEIFREIQI